MTRHLKFCLSLASLIVLIGLVHISPAVAEESDVYQSLLETNAQDEPSIPPGYSQDERGRIFQTSFDLRRRYHVGVYDLMRFSGDEGFGLPRHSLLIEAGGVQELYDDAEGHRHRHRFAQGRLMLAPFEIDALLYGYEFSRAAQDAPIWITTFVGEPRRFDVPITIGAGYSVGRLHYRRAEAGDLMLLDLAEAHVNWEFYQGDQMEDYLYLSTGAGVGLQHLEGTGRTDLYGFPELGLHAGWTIGDEGLTQIGFEGRMKWAWDLDSGSHWKMGTAKLSAERILIAINDQPLSIYAGPEVRYSDIPFADVQGLDLRAVAGVRLSLFAPPRGSELEKDQ